MQNELVRRKNRCEGEVKLDFAFRTLAVSTVDISTLRL